MIRRVALVTPEYPGCGPSHGVGRSVAVLAQALHDAGIDVRTLVSSDLGAFVVDHHHIQKCGSWDGPFALRPLLAATWMRDELARFAPDVVEWSNWGGLGACLRGPWIGAVRLSTSTTLIDGERFRRRLLRPIHLAWERRCVRRADVVISDSRAMAEVGAQLYARKADVIVPHAFATPSSVKIPEFGDLLFVGRLEARKGLDVLLEAWAKVIVQVPDRRLHLVGADPSGYGAALLGRGCPGVVWHGQLTDQDLCSLRATCAIQVVPSRFESFGIVVLEAWAAGLAVIASDRGALPEVVGDGGLCVPLTDAALADAIHRCFTESDLRQSFARAGEERLRTRHALPTLARDSLNAYARVMVKEGIGASLDRPRLNE
jgi:glycosyltransferase involved in cell wall biosynthesis